jgi:transketolase
VVEALPRYDVGSRISTRRASHDTLIAVAGAVPELVGGSADLSQSNLTDIEGSPIWTAGRTGRNIRFGVREHAMGAIANGLAYHGGIRPFVGTFFTFSDYMRGSVRLAALSGLPVIYVWTHDSIALGEDGPTHQPVEHLASFRAMPGLWVIRPADGNETSSAWEVALSRTDGPVALVLCRQDLPVAIDPAAAAAGVRLGAYTAYEASASPELIIIATGSEVQLAIAARERLEARGVRTRVVSMPCWELFQLQPDSYREMVLPRRLSKRLSVEAASSMGWERWVGERGAIIAVDQYGISGRGPAVCEAFGFTVDRVVEVATSVVAGEGYGVVAIEPAGMAPHTGRPAC